MVYLPVLLREYTTLGESQIGMYFFIGGLVAIAGALLSGLVAHRIEDETNVLRYGSISVTLGILCLIFSENVMFIYLSVFLLFFQRSTMYALGDEISINYLKNKNADFGKIRSFGSIGWGCNFLINGILVVYAPKLMLLEWFMVSIVFIFLAFKLPKSKVVKHKNDANLLSIFRVRNYVLFLLASGLMWGCINNVQTYAQFLVQDLGGNIALYGSISALAAILDFFVMQKSSSVLEKLGTYKYSLLLCLILLVKFIIITCSNNPALIYFSILFDPFFFGLIIPFSSQFVKKMVAESTSAMAITIVTTVNLFFGSILSLVFGYVYEFISPTFVFGIMSVLALGAMLIMIFVKVKETD